MMIDDLRLTNLSGLAGKGAAMAFWIAWMYSVFKC